MINAAAVAGISSLLRRVLPVQTWISERQRSIMRVSAPAHDQFCRADQVSHLTSPAPLCKFHHSRQRLWSSACLYQHCAHGIFAPCGSTPITNLVFFKLVLLQVGSRLPMNLKGPRHQNVTLARRRVPVRLHSEGHGLRTEISLRVTAGPAQPIRKGIK